MTEKEKSSKEKKPTPKKKSNGIKTKVNDASVEKFIDMVSDPQRKSDSRVLLAMMKEVTKKEPKMWGDSLIGFGQYHYKYPSGQEGEWPQVAFSPRKQSLSIYIMAGFEVNADLMAKLGKYKTGKGCLYIKSLKDIDQTILRQLIDRAKDYQYKFPR